MTAGDYEHASKVHARRSAGAERNARELQSPRSLSRRIVDDAEHRTQPKSWLNRAAAPLMQRVRVAFSAPLPAWKMQPRQFSSEMSARCWIRMQVCRLPGPLRYF